MHYYLWIEGVKKGPLAFDELIDKGLCADTLVWREGLTDWVKASELDELAELLARIPPSPPPYSVSPEEPIQRPDCPKTWLVESILATCLCCLPFGIVGIVYAAKVDSAYALGQYEAAVKYSKLARNWTLAAVVSIVVIGLLYLMFLVVLILIGKNAVDNSIMLSL